MELLFDRKLTCGICEHSFITKKVKSRYIRPLSHDSDFCTTYDSEETNPLLYYVTVCPNCGYSTTEEFSSHIQKEAKDVIKAKIQKHWQTKDYGKQRTVHTAINTYKLGIYSGIMKKETSIVMAGLYIRLAWIYRTVEINKSQEMRFLKLAVDHFELSYTNGDYEHKNMGEIKLLYLIGELQARLGNTRKAIQFFQRVIRHSEKEKEKMLVNHARNRWYDIRSSQKALHTSSK